jgi:hypothetical protein
MAQLVLPYYTDRTVQTKQAESATWLAGGFRGFRVLLHLCVPRSRQRLYCIRPFTDERAGPRRIGCGRTLLSVEAFIEVGPTEFRRDYGQAQPHRNRVSAFGMPTVNGSKRDYGFGTERRLLLRCDYVLWDCAPSVITLC